jgi:hypothetical protein
MSLTGRQIAREWLWIVGVAIAIGAAMVVGRLISCPTDPSCTAVNLRDWSTVTAFVYGVILIGRMTLWAFRTVRK